jgi:ParB-like chromosome segregation protein Spo0J
MKATSRATVKINSIIPNPRNNRVHPPDQIEMLKASIERFGQPRPVFVRKENRMLIAGHGIHQAMRDLGHGEIDVIFWDVDQKTADEYLLADNRLGELSHFHRDRTLALLEDVTEDAYSALGFTAEDVEALLEKVSKPPEVKQINTGAIADRFWITVQGPMTTQSAALQRIQHFMAEFPDVEIELGTLKN